MNAYTIPDYVKEGFLVLIKSSQEKIDKLFKELEETPKGLLPSELAKSLLSLSIFSEQELSHIVRVILSLYVLKDNENKGVDEIIDGICKALVETGDENLIPNENLENNLKRFFSLKTVGITFKAIGLLTEFDKTFVDARIITDIRPAFEDNINSSIETGVIVHNLRIKYQKDTSLYKEFYIALDNEDLSKLKEQIIRAENKEKSIRNSLKDVIFLIDTSKE